MKKTYLDEIREKEKKRELHNIPIAIFAILLMVLTLWMMYVDSFEVNGQELNGIALRIWFLSVIVAGGLALTFAVLSFNSLIFIGFLLKFLRWRPHPWKPLLYSTILLLLSSFLFVLAKFCEQEIRFNANAINSWVYSTLGTGMLYWAATLIGGLIFMLIVCFLGSLLIHVVMLPIKAKQVSEEVQYLQE